MAKTIRFEDLSREMQESAVKAYLGNNTRFVAAPVSEEESSFAGSIVGKYRLQSFIGAVVGNEYRVSWCMKHKLMSVEVRYKERRAWYSGLMRCGSAWLCPVCAAKIAAGRVAELTRLIKALEPEYTPYMLTYTASHNRETALSDSLTGITNAFRKMRMRRDWRNLADEYGMSKSVVVREVTWGPSNGWHAHLHEICFIRSKVHIGLQRVTDLADSLEQQLASFFWPAALAREGLFGDEKHSISVELGGESVAKYLAKFGDDYKVSGVHSAPEGLSNAGVAKEAALGLFKVGRDSEHYSFFGLCAQIEAGRYPRELIREYARSTKGKRVLRWSADLQELAGQEESDQNLSEREPDNYDVLAVLSDDDWKRVLRADGSGTLLKIAASGDCEQVLDYLATLAEMFPDNEP